MPEALTYAAGIATQQPRVLKAVDRFILTSEGSRRVLGELGLDLDAYDVIPNFLPAAAFAQRSAARAMASTRSTPGGWRRRRGSTPRSRLPGAAACRWRSPARGRTSRACGGSRRRQTRRSASWASWSSEALAKARAGAAVAVMPSRWHEPHPYAVSEAMAAGLPVLASRVGGLPEMVGEGATVDAGDPEAWADGLSELWRDPELRRRRGRRGPGSRPRAFLAGRLLRAADGQLPGGAAVNAEIPTRELLGVKFALTDYDGALRRIEEMVAGTERGYLCLTSVHGLMERDRDIELASVLNAATLNLPDGMPVVWALNLLSGGRPLQDRVYGPTLMERACERAAGSGTPIYLYGGHDEAALRELKTGLRRRSPGIEIAGAWSPPHRELTDDEEAELARRIDDSGAKIVWCGISTPRQEKWLARMRPLLAAPVMASVGAAFDFLAGRASQAPGWMQRRGLEWAYRFGPRAAPARAPLSALQPRLRRRGGAPVQARASGFRGTPWVESRPWLAPFVRPQQGRPTPTSGSRSPPTTSPTRSSRSSSRRSTRS